LLEAALSQTGRALSFISFEGAVRIDRVVLWYFVLQITDVHAFRHAHHAVSGSIKTKQIYKECTRCPSSLSLSLSLTRLFEKEREKRNENSTRVNGRVVI